MSSLQNLNNTSNKIEENISLENEINKNVSFTKNELVYVPTPSHGFVEAKITTITKDEISIVYTDDFIKESYGDDPVIYEGENKKKILKLSDERPFFWMFQNHKDFPEWVSKTFIQDSICNPSTSKSPISKSPISEFTLMPQQKFIRDYLGHQSPYRGLLLYHGLGSGKTCASIAVSENLKDTRDVVVLVPYKGIRDNFITQGLQFCGDPEYKKNNKIIKEKYTILTFKNAYIIKQIEKIGNLHNKIIIVDEAHNLATMMVNGLKKPNSHGEVLYRMLLEAKNSKIVFLTGTPLVNTPFECGILCNILRGQLELLLFDVQYFSETTIDAFYKKLLQDNRIGWIHLERLNKTLSIIPKIHSWDMEFEHTIYFIQNTAKEFGLDIEYKKVYQFPLFPEKQEEFENMFIQDNTIYNRDMFQRRIIGLISYFEATNEAKKDFPEQLPTIIQNVEMSDHQFAMYKQARDTERPMERRAAQKRKSGSTSVSTTGRIFSREFCNFVYPNEIERPFKKMQFITKLTEQKKKEVEQNNIKNIEEIENTLEKNYKTLQKEIQESLQKLSNHPNNFLEKINLYTYSPKMKIMLDEIEKNDKGIILIYSSFRNVEGLEIFGRVLMKNGYSHFLDTNSKNDYKKFAFYSGVEDKKTKKSILSKITHKNNMYGKDIRILLLSSAGAEGLDLKNIQKVLIMDAFWHNVRTEQIIGRAVRNKSHIDLPEKERKVKVIIYSSIFSESQKENYVEKETTDEYIYRKSQEKLKLNNSFLEAMKESAIDCMLNQCDRKCYTFTKGTNSLAYLPLLQDDILYNIQSEKEVKTEMVVAGLTKKDNILVYKKNKKWYNIIDTPLENVQLQKVKLAVDKISKKVYDYNDMKKNIKTLLGTYNVETGKIQKI